MAKLTAKQRRFCDEYLIDLNATQAAIRAGYSVKTAGAIGLENLGKPLIAEYLAVRMQERAERTEITQDYVLNGIKDTVERCRGRGPAFDPGNALKGLEILGRHLGMFKADNDQKDRLVIIKDFTGEAK